jgi:uncharacterized protein
MSGINLLIKPSSYLCNLECTYCFYRKTKDIYDHERPLMSVETAAAMIQKALSLGRVHNSFCWQGGEPTLSGLDFYREIVNIQKESAMPHQSVENSFQTNGVLINQDWADFFRENNFLVGLSLDGPEGIHNKYRRFPDGRGSYNNVIQKAALLEKNKVAFNILTLLTDANIHGPGRLYSFFRQNGFDHLQFIPCIEKNPNTGKPRAFSVKGPDLGKFYCDLFDLWVRDGFPYVSIRLFEDILIYMLDGIHASCSWLRECSSYLLVEYNGDCYPCDFFVSPEWKLGNITEQTFESLEKHHLRTHFAKIKSDLPQKCRDCRWLHFCNGDCPRYRKESTDTVDGGDELCEAWSMLLEHIESHPVDIKAEAIRAREEYNRSLLPKTGRNDPCPCGSGKKYKKCCLGKLN